MIVVAFCAVWPFLAMASIPRRGRSSAPLAAVLVAVAVVLCGLWLSLADSVRIAGYIPWRPSVVQTLESLKVVLWPIIWIAILSLVLRHRPMLDRYVVALSVILAIDLLTAVLFVEVLAPSDALSVFARVAAAATIAMAMIAALRLFFATARA